MSANSHRIALSDAVALVQHAQETPPRLVKGWTIDGAIINEILAQPAAAQLRVYIGSAESGDATLIFVGVDAAGKDLSGGTIAQHAVPCPPFCDPDSAFA